MNLPRRTFLQLAAAAAALPAARRLEAAPAYPTRPVRIVVGYPPGGITDIMGRLIAPWLSERMGQQFFVENRPGASSNLAADLVVRAVPDGHTLFLLSATNAYNATLYDNLTFDITRDMVPVASIGRDAFVMVTIPSVPASTGAEFVAYAKANPGKINLATSGTGSASDLYAVLFKNLAGVELTTVHYRGVGQTLPDLLAGRVQVIFLPVPSALAYIRDGKLRALGVTTPTRRAVLPDVPPISDFVPGYEATDWTGISAPARTPGEIVTLLNREINAALADPAFVARLAELGVEPFASSPAAFATFIAAYRDSWSKVIRAAHLKPE
jgi:tripartite-type tricarboxylate transporter receptor subunit TctC